jgi:hypothetical protein
VLFNVLAMVAESEVEVQLLSEREEDPQLARLNCLSHRR